METVSKIYFLNSPYPNGHQIIAFNWSGKIDEDESVWFDFHLKTEKYYADDQNEDIEEKTSSNWDSKIVWGNYHACILSSTYWGDQGGIRIDKPGEKVDFDSVTKSELHSNDLPSYRDFEEEDLAFNIYLLGHDSCAGHKIKFSKNDNHRYTIEWTGKIALTYSGDDEFSHDFKAHIRGAAFDGFHYPKNWSVEKATEVFKTKLADFENYEFVDLNPKSNKREFKVCRINK
ncbi:hypothetical protein MP478_01220 [Chryseobacterium sp. WG14]|uniref:hypothetical protein n=1 Tax=Chryseobacterium sp. WG14 TaxID=2926909 RepID=UPI00211DA940|nr:hypothetical protein [Chryseobacterium sp. WG14]MCQ9637992.1 hypothetical protein [Chryseobacterium sp. WG14]